jgi:hypothetical protein
MKPYTVLERGRAKSGGTVDLGHRRAPVASLNPYALATYRAAGATFPETCVALGWTFEAYERLSSTANPLPCGSFVPDDEHLHAWLLMTFDPAHEPASTAI